MSQRTLGLRVIPDPERERFRIDWTLSTAEPSRTEPEVARYEVWIGFGEEAWLPLGVRREPWVSFSWSLLDHSIPVGLGLRVRAMHTDGSYAAVAEASFELPARRHLQPARDWRIEASTTAVDDATRRQAGLEWWVDGNMGFVEMVVDGSAGVYGFGPNGPKGSRWKIGEKNFLDAVLETSVSLDTTWGGEPIPHASGGPVYRDIGTGVLLMLYHAERWPEGDGDRFWSYIGLARSTDHGSEWLDLGPIIEPNLAMESDRRVILTEVGGAPYLVHDADGVEHMYVYFRDTLADGSDLRLSVARAPMGLVVQEALGGAAAPFEKWTGTDWNSPGRGGISAELLPNSPILRWFDIVSMSDLGIYVLVASNGVGRDWGYVLTTSTDGMDWTDPVDLGPPIHGGELLYLSLSSPDRASQRNVRGDTVHLYQTRCAQPHPHRWDDASIERLDIRYGPDRLD